MLRSLREPGGRPVQRVSKACGPTAGPAIGPACYGFECVNNLGYGDRRHNLYRRGGPQKWLHSLQIRQDALLLVSTLAEGLVERVAMRWSITSRGTLNKTTASKLS